MKKQTTATALETTKHNKRQILSSRRFAPLDKDFLQALLRDDESYTVSEAAHLLAQYLKQEAK